MTSVSPTSGLTAGGTSATVTGTGLAGATVVTFGPGNPASAVSCAATSCTVTPPLRSPNVKSQVKRQVQSVLGSPAFDVWLTRPRPAFAAIEP